MTTGKTRECQAKNPSACKYHGQPPAGEIWILPPEPETNTTPPPSPALAQALHSSLEYEGKLPSWWKKYVRECETNDSVQTTPKIIDMVEVNGEKYAVVWEEHSQSEVDKFVITESGMQVSQVRLIPMDKKKMREEDSSGYIKVSHVDDASQARSFGDDEYFEFRYAARFNGSYSHRNMSNPPSLADKQKMFLACYKLAPEMTRYKDGKIVSEEEYKATMPNTEEGLNAALSSMRPHIRKEMHIDHKAEAHKYPFVDYSKLPEKLQNTGLGTAMYVYAARVLGEKGHILRGSGIQSDEAVRIWSRFNKKMPGHVGKISLEWFDEINTSYILDFRKK